MKTINPKTATEALRYARTAERAQHMAEEGYTFRADDLADDCYFCTKPDGTLYFVNLLAGCCTCPDFQRHHDFCKHLIGCSLNEQQESAQLAELDRQAELEKDAHLPAWMF
jgi:hypothetical protein